MSQILSQDEVDALLKGLDTGDVETDKDAFETEPEYQTYDWSTQGKNRTGKWPLCPKIEASLIGFLEKDSQCGGRRFRNDQI